MKKNFFDGSIEAWRLLGEAWMMVFWLAQNKGTGWSLEREEMER